MKILIISNTFWPDYAGWINQILGLIKSCKYPGCAFTLITRKNLDRDEKHPLLKDIKIVELQPSITIQTNFSRLRFLIPVLSYLLKNKGQFDVIFLPTAYLPLPFIVPFAKMIGKPIVSRIAINELIGTNIFSKIRRALILLSDGIVCLNKQTLKSIIRKKNGKPVVRYIPNGIDYSNRDDISHKTRISLRNKLGISHDEKVVCFAGLINRRKGVDTLIRSFCEIQDTTPNPHLVLVGPYQGANEIETNFVRFCKSLIQGDNNEERIHFVGRVDNLKEYLFISDVFVLPSLSEGMPNVLLEAMAAGLPCVCSDIPGIRELITSEKNGILVQPGDIAGFTAAITQLLSNPDICARMGKESILRIERGLTMQKISRMYQDLFAELTGK